jgi:U6 snRNA phosphodiesterase
MLRTEQRGAFLEKLEDAVGRSGVRPFQVFVTGLDWVPNANNTRWFLVLGLERPENDGLNHLLAVTNCVARDSGLEMLYADQEPCEEGLPDQPPRLVQLHAGRRGVRDKDYMQTPANAPADYSSKFHLSIAWQLQEPDKGGLASIEAIESVQQLSISCDCLKVKIGNAIHHISLSERRLSEQGSGGT